MAHGSALCLRWPGTTLLLVAFVSPGCRLQVGILDTGLDYTHPDLADQVDYANSVSCVSGTPNSTRESYQDPDGHGTWCARLAQLSTRLH